MGLHPISHSLHNVLFGGHAVTHGRSNVRVTAANGSLYKVRPLPMLQMSCGHSAIAATSSYGMTTEEEMI
jgi:hypothetical protein